MSEEDRARWNRRYRERGPSRPTPSPHLQAYGDILPRTGRALDVAGGEGANAVWLAQHGLDVTMVDIADVALERARDLARAAGVRVQTAIVDVDSVPLPAGPWDVVIDFHFLSRSLIPEIVVRLSVGGYFLWVHPTQRNLERHSRPGPRHLLETGEAARLIADLDKGDLQIIDCQEGWSESNRHESRLLVRRAPAD